MELRRDRRYSYFLLVTPVLIIFTVLGWRINNVLLAYVLTIFGLLVPGLRYKGLLQVSSWLARLADAASLTRSSLPVQVFTARLKPLFWAPRPTACSQRMNGSAKLK